MNNVAGPVAASADMESVAGDHADVVVVGGGHNGLICATYLARAGRDTIVVEASPGVGGCSATVSDLDARFNICNCDHTMVRAMPLLDELELGRHGLSYLEADPAFVHLTWDGAAPWLFFHDQERTIDSIARARPTQAEAYRRYLRDAMPVAELLLELAVRPASSAKMLGAVLERRGRGAARLWRWSRASAVAVLSQYFDDEAMMMPAISTGPTVWGIPPDSPGSGLAAAGAAMRHLVPTGRPYGGSGALSDALSRAFQAAGGRIHCGVAVTELVGSRGAVAGVRLADGSEISATTVVTAFDPRVVATGLIGGDIVGVGSDGSAATAADPTRSWLPRLGWPGRPGASGRVGGIRRAGRAGRYVARWHETATADGYESKIDAVISDLPCYQALDGFEDLFADRDPNDSSFVISPSLEGLIEAHRLRAAGRVAPHPTMISNVPSVLDPSLRSGDGHHILSLEVLFTPYALQGGWEGSQEPRRWLDLWSGLVQPGFLHSVDRYRAMTPDRYERELHLLRGHAPSYTGSPLQTLLGRRRDVSRYRTPVAGLFMCGAGTYPGAGIWGASGRNAAAVVLDSTG